MMMATCPRCGQFLDDDHRCTGLWRRRVRAAGAMLGGAALSLLALFIVSDNPTNAVVALGVVSGMVLGGAVWAIISE